MTNAHHYARSLLAASVSCFVVLASGCSTIGPGDASVLDLPGQAAESVTDLGRPSGGVITTEIRRDGKEPEIGKMPLAGVVRVQEALEEIGATKRFRRMNVRVMRPAGGQRQRLEVKYDHNKRSVNPLYDYVLHPGDHVVVIEDKTTAFDEMLQSVTGTVGLPARH